MVTVSHQGCNAEDIIKTEAKTSEEALKKLLELRGVDDLSALEPAIIETRWC